MQYASVLLSESPFEAVNALRSDWVDDRARVALHRLREGNQRFLSGATRYSHCEKMRRASKYMDGDCPSAVVLGCSDLHVPVELVFDTAEGGLFVVRAAGNVCRDGEMALLEYAIDCLNVPLCVVLGHTRCETVSSLANGYGVGSQCSPVVSAVYSSLRAVRTQEPAVAGDRLVDAAVRANVFRIARQLVSRESGVIGRAVEERRTTVIPAIYDIVTGRVDWL